MGDAPQQKGDGVPGEQWAVLIEIHNQAKTVFLIAEEFDGEFRDFLQPALELRHAMEHVVRAKAAELGLNSEGKNADPAYIHQSFDKAIGHEYRAFFDAADWLSMCIRARIVSALTGFSPNCIKEVLPAYYTELRPKIDEACLEIARIRGAKDIAKPKGVTEGSQLLEEVKRYRGVLNELLGIHATISARIPAMVDLRRKAWWSAFGGYLASVLIGGTIAAIVTAWFLLKLKLKS